MVNLYHMARQAVAHGITASTPDRLHTPPWEKHRGTSGLGSEMLDADKQDNLVELRPRAQFKLNFYFSSFRTDVDSRTLQAAIQSPVPFRRTLSLVDPRRTK